MKDCIFLLGPQLFRRAATFGRDLVNAGGNWVDSDAVVDRNWISSKQPSDIPKFNEKIKEFFWGGARQQPSRAKAASK